MNSETDGLEPVDGLVDNRRAAAMLGVPVNTFRVWASRSQQSGAGISAMMPRPVATMHGNVYRAEEIEEYGRQLAGMRRTPRNALRKSGQYYTPDDATRFMVEWAVKTEHDQILEPSVGDGQFARAIDRFATLRNWQRPNLHACELDSNVATEVLQTGTVQPGKLHIGDFLTAPNLPLADVVIGNPPYIRLRDLEAKPRDNAQRAAETYLGRAMDPAGSIWMPFVARATAQLKANGRLAFVLPSDFTYVRYARPLWEFLARSYGKLSVVRVRERIFPNIMQNVMILLAESRGKTTNEVTDYTLRRVQDINDINHQNFNRVEIRDIVDGRRVFQYSLLSEDTRRALEEIAPYTEQAQERVKFNIGYVSGNKKFFQPSQAIINEYDLPSDSLLPTVETSRQMASLGLSTGNAIPPAKLWLPDRNLTAGEKRYVESGELSAVDMSYKCRIRRPWYKVPGVRVPDLLLTAFSDRPRLHLNEGKWVASNSVLCGFTRNRSNSRRFISSWYTPLTLISTELQVHSLGGGVMIAVPNEANSILTLKENSTATSKPGQIDQALRSKHIEAAYNVGARSVQNLIGQEGVVALLEGAETLASWRKAKS